MVRNKALALTGVMVIATLALVAVGRGAESPKTPDVSDSIATAAYLDAEYRALLSTKADSMGTARAIADVVTGADKCPRVASGVPYGSRRSEVEAWVSDVIDLAIVRSEVGIDSRFRKAVIRLHWSDPRIALLVAANLRKLQRETEVRMPPLCQNLSIWANDGFRRAPMRLLRFVHEFDDLSEGEDKVPAALRRFERAGDKDIVQTIDRDKPSVDRAIRHTLWIGWEHMLGVLGL
jgi:hypothetical protein